MEQIEYDLIAALKKVEELTKAKPERPARPPADPSREFLAD
jgi:hypothetical protein